MGLIIYHTNMIEGATLSYGSWTVGLPLERLRDPRPKLRARSVDTQLTSTRFRIGLSGPVNLLGIQLIATNVSNAGRYRATWYTDNTYTTAIDTTGWRDVGESIDWSDTGEWLEWEDPDFWLGSPAFVDPDNQGRDIRIVLDAAISAQYFLIEIDDTGNADTYVEIGHVYIGSALVPRYNFAEAGNSFMRKTNTTSIVSSGLTRYSRRRASTKCLMVAWPILPVADVLGEIDDMVQVHDIDKPVYVDVFPDNNGYGVKTAFLATMAKLPDHELVKASIDGDIAASAGFEFTQVQ